jgi:Ni/Co efflux regulator RcnB
MRSLDHGQEDAMRRMMLAVLLASVVSMPALAQDQGHHRDRSGEPATDNDGDEARAARRAERIERRSSERPVPTERAPWADSREDRQPAPPQSDGSAQVIQPSAAQLPWQQSGEQRRWGRRGDRPRDNGGEGREQVGIDGLRTGESQPTARPFDQGPGQWRRSERPGGRTRDDRPDRNPDWRQDRGTVVVHRDDHRRGAWSNQWHHDRNYDWRRYRDHNRSLFRIGHYRDPYGSRYRRFSIGFSLFPSYYQSNYWLDDPSVYRLPPAYGPYRWVRYYDDALLVNIYTGQVVDVVYSFFW